MRIFAFAALLAMAMSFATPLSIAAQSTLTGVQKFERHMRAVSSMTADFSQQGPGSRNETGRLSIKRPGKIRFEYQNGMMIVGNRSHLSMSDPGAAAVRLPLSDSPLSVLIDSNREITQSARTIRDDENSLLIEFSDPRRPQFGRITLGFAKIPGAPGGLQLQGWNTTGTRQNTTQVRLSGQRYNVLLPDSAFLLPPIAAPVAPALLDTETPPPPLTQQRPATPYDVVNEVCLTYLAWATRSLQGAKDHALTMGFRLDQERPNDFTLSRAGATLELYRRGSDAGAYAGCKYRLPNYAFSRVVSELGRGLPQWGFQRGYSDDEYQKWTRGPLIDLTIKSFDFSNGETEISIVWSATPEEG